MMSFHEPSWWCGSSAGPCPCRPFTEIVISTYGFVCDLVAWQIVILPAGRSSRPPLRGVPTFGFACDFTGFDWLLPWLLPWLEFDLPCDCAWLLPWLEFDLPCDCWLLPCDLAAGWLLPWASLPAGP